MRNTRRNRHGTASQCRKLPLCRGRRTHLRSIRIDVPRPVDQHIHAAVQDARRRHGQREAEGPRLLHTELPV